MADLNKLNLPVMNQSTGEVSYQEFNLPGGSGSGDMSKSVYDPNNTVSTAGGITDYVAGVLPDVSTKMTKSDPTGTGSFSLNRKADTTVGSYSFAEGYNPTASGSYSHAEGQQTIASGQSSHAEGQQTTASSNYSHAEGYGTTASNNGSHAEGVSTTASGYASHAEGYMTTASGNRSHAEGKSTSSVGDYSHAEGSNTEAGYAYQHVGGKYNSNKSTTLLEVGNGTSTSARSNAFEVYSDGSLSTDNGTTKTKLPVVKTGTIANGSVTFTNLPSSGNNMIDFYTSVPGANYTAISTSGTSVTLTYDSEYDGATAYCSITEVV